MATAQTERRPLGPRDADAGLLSTKLAVPRVPPAYISRPSVGAMLAAGTRGPLTVVSAGAGWGKTLATAHWAATDPEVGPVAWLSLDGGDNEPRQFWSYFVAALRSVCALPPTNPLAELMPGFASEDEFLSRFLLGVGDLPEPVVVVLDDFQVIHNSAVLARLTELLRHPVDQLRLVVLTRADPDLPLHRLRMTGDLEEIRPLHLAFDVNEASSLFDAHGVPVTLEEAHLLVDRTEGWPAGLRLAALFLGNEGSERRASEFAGDDQTVAGYLAEEVFGNQPAEMQRFLLRTSVVARVSSQLAEELTGEPRSQQHLEDLERSNAFVFGLGPGREWFRYHALLREMLRHRLLVDSPELLPDLHRRAARWFADHGRPIEALGHAADAEDWSLLGRLFVTHAAHLTVSVDRGALNQVLGSIPGQRLADGPELALCAAAQLFHAARYEEMEAHLQLARAHLDAGHPDPQGASRVVLLLLTCVLSRTRGDIATVVDAAGQALDIVSDEGRFLPSAPAYRAIALGNLGTGLVWSGKSGSAQEHLAEGLAAAEKSRIELALVNTLAYLGLALAEQGHLHAGSAHALRAIEIVKARGWAPLPQAATAYLALASIELQRDNVALGEDLLTQGRSAAREPAARMAIDLAQVRLDASLGRVEAARTQLTLVREGLRTWHPPLYLARWLAISEAQVALAAGEPAAAATSVGAAPDHEPPYAHEQLCLARAFLMVGDPQGAETLLGPLREGTPVEGPPVEVWLLTALAADALREDNRAVDALRHALELAAPEQIRRPFAELGADRLPRLLTRLGEIDAVAASRAQELLGTACPDATPTPTSDVLADPLTDREVMVLRFLPTMKTNAEIAAELYLSVNTVKAHLKHIFRKLDVDSRREAAQRARDLGLLAGSGENGV